MRAGLTFPVLMKEMRSRMRGKRIPVLLFLTTALAAFVGLLVLFFASDQYGNYAGSGFTKEASAMMGRALFGALMVLEGLVCSLLTPALCAGAIALEVEMQSLDFLLLTRLSSWNIVLGKYISALSMVGIVFLCSIPVIAISFMLGGVDPFSFCISVVQIATRVLLFGAIGLCCSAYFRKTPTSLAVAYGASLMLPILPLLLLIVIAIIDMYTSGNDLLLFISILTVSSLLAAGVAKLVAFILHLAERQISQTGRLLWFTFSGLAFGLLTVAQCGTDYGWFPTTFQRFGLELPTSELQYPPELFRLFARRLLIMPRGSLIDSMLDILPLLLHLLFSILCIWVLLVLTVRALNRRRAVANEDKWRLVIK